MASVMEGKLGINDHVSEATISKLLNDFNCASLLTRSATAKDQKSSSTEESQSHYEKVLSSLKHLHLKRPINCRSRLKEKRNIERKAKAVLADKYNLSIAAVHAQKPIIWPGKLSCVSKKTESDTIIFPSRLSTPLKNDQPSHNASFFNASIHTSPSEERSRIAASLEKQNLPLFDIKGVKQKDNRAKNVSFSFLHKQNLKNFKEESTSSTEASANCNIQNSEFLSLVRSQGYRSSLPTKHPQNVAVIVDHNQSCKYTSDTDANGNDNNNSVSSRISSPSHINQPSNMAPATGISTSVIERSCSEEMRMEESNVNELASYFEDFLHIPRKMSVMAEMMYA